MRNPWLPKEDMSPDVFLLWDAIEKENIGYLTLMLDRIEDPKKQSEGIITLEFYQIGPREEGERVMKVHRVFYTMLDGTFENGIYEALIKMNTRLSTNRNNSVEGAV